MLRSGTNTDNNGVLFKMAVKIVLFSCR